MKLIQQAMSIIQVPSRAGDLLVYVRKVSQLGKGSRILPSVYAMGTTSPGQPQRASGSTALQSLCHPIALQPAPHQAGHMGLLSPDESTAVSNGSTYTQRSMCYTSKVLDNVFLEVTSFGLRP